MIYGGHREDGQKIAADGPITELKSLQMRWKTVELFRSFGPHGFPHLDVGSGDSVARKIMTGAQGTDIDLDTQGYAYPGGTFKTITSFEVLEHLYNPLFHLQEIRRILQPGGFLYLATPNDWCIPYQIEHLRRRKYGSHFHQFNEFDLRQIMARAGLEITHLSTYRRGGSGTITRLFRNNFFLICKV